MSSNRIDFLPNNKFLDMLKSLTTYFRSYKAPQRQSGKGGMLGYLTKTASTWDINAVFTGNNLVVITVRFTADGKQDYPIIQPYLDIFIDNPNNEDYRLNDSKYSVINGNNAAFLVVMNEYNVNYAADKRVYEWKTSFSISGSPRVYAKAYAVGSSAGTLSVGVTN